MDTYQVFEADRIHGPHDNLHAAEPAERLLAHLGVLVRHVDYDTKKNNRKIEVARRLIKCPRRRKTVVSRTAMGLDGFRWVYI